MEFIRLLWVYCWLSNFKSNTTVLLPEIYLIPVYKYVAYLEILKIFPYVSSFHHTVSCESEEWNTLVLKGEEIN